MNIFNNMLPNYSLNNFIDASTGLALLHLSVSGLMCTRKSNNCSQSSSCPSNNLSSSCESSRALCSMTNFNLGLSGTALTGALLVYRGLRN